MKLKKKENPSKRLFVYDGQYKMKPFRRDLIIAKRNERGIRNENIEMCWDKNIKKCNKKKNLDKKKEEATAISIFFYLRFFVSFGSKELNSIYIWYNFIDCEVAFLYDLNKNSKKKKTKTKKKLTMKWLSFSFIYKLPLSNQPQFICILNIPQIIKWKQKHQPFWCKTCNVRTILKAEQKKNSKKRRNWIESKSGHPKPNFLKRFCFTCNFNEEKNDTEYNKYTTKMYVWRRKQQKTQ